MFPRMLAVVDPWPRAVAGNSSSVHSVAAAHIVAAPARLAPRTCMALL
jgi:hypothetical protein